MPWIYPSDREPKPGKITNDQRTEAPAMKSPEKIALQKAMAFFRAVIENIFRSRELMGYCCCRQERRYLMKKTLFLFILAFLFRLLASAPAMAISLGFAPSSQTVVLGDSVDVDIVISGLTADGPDSLGSFDLDATYDPSVLNFSQYGLGSYLGDLGLSEAGDFSLGEYTPGTINISELSFLDADSASGPSYIPPYLDIIQPSSFTIATLTFDAIGGEGSESLLEFTSGSGGNLPELGDALGNALSPVIQTSGSITVTAVPVPEPTTLLLLGLGLIAMAGVYRKKRKG